MEDNIFTLMRGDMNEWKPKWLIMRFLRYYINFRNRSLSQKNSIKVIDQDWDYLIILDACRYDMYKIIVDKNADYIISGGSDTQEWLQWNFNGNFDDIVYIAGNPHLSSYNLVKTFGFNPFHEVVEVWDFGWDEYYKTVHPKEVTKASLSALKRFPDKRMIIHYNQPHHPFIGDEELLKLDEGTTINPEKIINKEEKSTVWALVRKGKISLRKAWKAYLKNLKIVMKEVYRLVNALSGKVVVSADHGNLVGEYMFFGHIDHMRAEQLVIVPWHVIKDERRIKSTKIKAETPLLEDKIIKKNIEKF
jgi:hypothetical protein